VAGTEAYLLGGPAPSTASILPIQASCSTVVGKLGHQNTLNVLAQKYLTWLALLQTGGWTSRGPLQTTFFLQLYGAMKVQSVLLEALVPCLPRAASCTLWAINKHSNSREPAAEHDVAVPRARGEYPLSPEKSL